MDDNEDQKFIIPKKIILPFFLSLFKANSVAWSNALKNRKIPVPEIEKMQAEVLGKMKATLLQCNERCCHAVEEYHEKIEFEEKRADFLGRALIESKFAKFFPKDRKSADLLQKRSIPELLPNQISTPIIEFVKLTTGASTANEYAETCKKIARSCKNTEDRLIDWEAYFAHEKVKEILDDLFERFRKIFRGRDSDRRREWLTSRVSEAESIMKMTREITDEEYELMERILLGK